MSVAMAAATGLASATCCQAPSPSSQRTSSAFSSTGALCLVASTGRRQQLSQLMYGRREAEFPRSRRRKATSKAVAMSGELGGGPGENGEVCCAQTLEFPAGNRSFHVVQILESVAPMVVQMGDAVRGAVRKPNTEEEVQLLTVLKGRMICAAAPIFFAAISQSVNTPLTVVASGMAKWLELYSGVLMVRVLLSWFPNIPWERQPLQAMRDMCDPYLNLFRNIIPPLFNALDLSPMLAFLVLGVLTSILNTTVQST